MDEALGVCFARACLCCARECTQAHWSHKPNWLVVAGCRADVIICCLDAFGNQLKERELLLEGHFTVQGATPAAMPHPCEAADIGNGMYALFFTPQTAGVLEVSRVGLPCISRDVMWHLEYWRMVCQIAVHACCTWGK